MEKITSKSIRTLRDKHQEQTNGEWIGLWEAKKLLMLFDGNVDYALDTLKANPKFSAKWNAILFHLYDHIRILEERIEQLEKAIPTDTFFEEKSEDLPMTANPYLKKTSKEEADKANPYRKEREDVEQDGGERGQQPSDDAER